LQREGRTTVVLAADAELFQREGAQWVRLRDGRRYDEGDAPLAFRVERFAWQELRLRASSSEVPKFKMKAAPLAQLLLAAGTSGAGRACPAVWVCRWPRCCSC